MAPTTKKDLLRMFTDEGDEILGRVLLEPGSGRLMYETMKQMIPPGLDEVLNFILTAPPVHPLVVDPERNRVLILKMMEKVVSDFTREKLRQNS